jgi:TolC family type I secretion outer membrane protein
LRQRNVGVLQQQARATQERLAAEDATRTDVAQARARVSAAQAELASARANLAASVANYQTIVGNKPGSLNYPRLAKLPGSLDGALGISQDVNPNILAAALVQEASEYTVEVVKGDLLPELSLQASASLTHEPSEGAESSRAGKIEGVLTIPLYEAGRVYSSVRKAKHEASQRKIQVIEASRAVRESVAASWAYLDAARQGIASAKTQVSAAQLALQGVREEYNIGSRTLLDVLNAEQEVLNAQIAQVSTERDQVVASYQVLAAMGKLTARNLSLRVDYYDPEENYLDVRDKWIGTGANTVE